MHLSSKTAFVAEFLSHLNRGVIQIDTTQFSLQTLQDTIRRSKEEAVCSTFMYAYGVDLISSWLTGSTLGWNFFWLSMFFFLGFLISSIGVCSFPPILSISIFRPKLDVQTRMVKTQMEHEWPLSHLGSIWYHSEPSDVRYSENEDQFLGLDFSYSKTTLGSPNNNIVAFPANVWSRLHTVVNKAWLPV